MSGICYNCKQCGNPILSPNRRTKYCTDECAKEAYRAKCREYSRRYYQAKPKERREYYHQYYMKHREERIATALARYYKKKELKA